MSNNKIIQEAISIARKRETVPPDQGEYYLEKAEKILLDHLENNPKDTQAWLLLIRIEWNCPLEDRDRIIKWSNKILAYDPTNPYALLFLADANHGGVTEEIYNQLLRVNTNDPYIQAMIEVAKAYYLEDKPELKNEYEQVLKKSVELAPEQAKNCRMLGTFYIKEGYVAKGEALIQKSDENAQRALSNDDTYDPTDIMGFLNEFYAGLY